MKNKNLNFKQAIEIVKHEKRRIRRGKESFWCEMHDGKLIRASGSGGGTRGLTVEDVFAEDWEAESVYRQLSGDDIRAAMLDACKKNSGRVLSPMHLLNEAIEDLGL